ncbi:hypothetical protein [Acinetobacter sp. ASP199]|uniref:hypothetical protein n=1 Tax=unclassified Acinetobacter TaxID=196816 RepID=UPI001F605359|nr:hypothetical protein [Acinetobacter sp. ASP199]UNT58779.1 hypothetical protein IHE35_11860 [Acinetobacter sp. ASP199]
MPIDAVQHSIHIRRKKNDVVFRNIARLWDLGRQAETHQDLLDGLHPWNGPITLKFENNLPLALAVFGVILVLAIFIAPNNIWMQSSVFLGCLLMFWAYISFEHRKPIDDVIAYLEEIALSKKYQLAFQQQPQHISIPLNPIQFIGQLKRLFPLFDRGSLSNEISRYASSVWEDENGQQHQVLVFQYHYIDELQVRDKEGKAVKVMEVHKDLWGVFVFDIQIQGLAVSTSKRKFYHPYSHPWHSSDIRTNQRLGFYGSNPMQMAKLLTPGFVMRLADFFEQRQGDLLFHPEKHMLCYLGPHDLFKVSSQNNNINDIPALRGHLRTFKLVALEKLKTDLIQFLK